MDTSESIGNAIRSSWAAPLHEDIIDWAKENIDFSEDASAERSRIDFDLSPFLVEPLRCWDFSGKIREVAVCGIEQHGKTLLEVIGVLYNFLDKPTSNLCVYPSEEAAADINRTKYLPLIRKIPALAAELERPFSMKKDQYIFGAATMFFQGAGIKIMSKSCKIRVADEEDQFPVVKNLMASEDIRKRGRSYSESIFYRVCTPTEENGPIWQAFMAGSQGYWTLRCLKCGKLTMRSCDFRNFQFESVFDDERGMYLPVCDSIRLICPECHHEHREPDKREMNIRGAYVHRFPDRIDLRPSFQFGALCSQFPSMSWAVIAAKVLECGRRSDVKAHYELDNSFKGLPYKPREISTEDCQNLKAHFYHARPPASTVEMVFVVSDTQDTFSPTGVFALDASDNLWLLEYANIPHLWLGQEERERMERQIGEKIRTVEDITNTPQRFPGSEEPIFPVFSVVDYRGHRQPEIRDYARTHKKVIMYAGAGGRMVDSWHPSSKDPRMMIVNAKAYQRTLIWHLYKQRSKTSDYLYLPDDLPDDTQKEIVCVQPDRTRKSGHLPENWAPEHDAVHDAFDVIKMAYFAVDFAIQSFRRDRFRIGQSPALLRRWRAQDERRQKVNTLNS